MTYYNLNPSEVNGMLKNLGYHVPDDMLKRNFDYYFKRTSHGSTLSRVVHAYLARLSGNSEISWDLYIDALSSDYNDIQGGTTGEGIHVGVMGGTVLLAITLFAGLNWQGEALRLDPDLPPNWNEMQFSFNFRGGEYHFTIIDNKKVKVTYRSDANKKARIFIKDMVYEVVDKKMIEVDI